MRVFLNLGRRSVSAQVDTAHADETAPTEAVAATAAASDTVILDVKGMLMQFGG